MGAAPREGLLHESPRPTGGLSGRLRIEWVSALQPVGESCGSIPAETEKGDLCWGLCTSYQVPLLLHPIWMLVKKGERSWGVGDGEGRKGAVGVADSH